MKGRMSEGEKEGDAKEGKEEGELMKEYETQGGMKR